MSPLKHSTNVAARMGRWSARHRKTAIFGWLAFVVAAFAVGIAVPHADDRRDRLERRRGPPGRPHHPRRRVRARRAVRVRAHPVGHARPSTTPRFARSSTTPSSTLRSFDAGHEAPLAARGGQRGPDLDGRPLGADPVQPGGLLRRRGRRTSTRSPTATEKVQDAEPRLLRRPGRLRLDGQGARRDVQGPARDGGPPLDPAHARDPAARVRLARRRVDPAPARAHLGVRDHGARRAAEPDRPDGRVDLGGHPPDRARGRSRLLALLHPPRA